MTKIALRTLIAISLIVLGYFLHASYSHEVIVAFVSENAFYIFVVAGGVAIGLIIVLIGAFLIIRHVLKKRLGVAITDDASVIVQTFADQVTNREGIENPNAQERMNSLIVSAGLFWLRREMLHATLRNALLFIASVGGLLTVVLLYEQNQRIQLQTHADISAALLTEGARRAALAQDLSRLFAALDKEMAEAKGRKCDETNESSCWKNYQEKDSRSNIVTVTLFIMSNELSRKIKSSTDQHQPYYLISPKLNTLSRGINFENPIKRQFDYPYLSPERAQILSYLATNEVQIPHWISFKFADLRHQDFQGNILKDLELDGANMQGVNFSLSILENTRLINADLRNANLQNTNLEWSKLEGVDLRNSVLENANMRHTRLMGANFHGANLFNADLRQLDFSFIPSKDVLATKRRVAYALSQAKNLEGIKLPNGWEVEGVGTVQSPYRVKIDGVYADEELPDSSPYQ